MVSTSASHIHKDIKWEKNVTLHRFLNDLSRLANCPRPVGLWLSDSFLENYLELSEIHSNAVLLALRKVPIEMVSLISESHFRSCTPHNARKTRNLTKLLTTLGESQTLSGAAIYVYTTNWIHLSTLQSLPRLTKMVVCAKGPLAKLGNFLRDNATLQHIDLFIPIVEHASFLSVLRTMPFLTSVHILGSLDRAWGSRNDEYLTNGRAIGDLLRGNTTIRKLRLHDVPFFHDHSHFCQAIARATIDTLIITACDESKTDEPDGLARAIGANLHIQRLEIQIPELEDAISFMNAFANAVSSMERLEHFDFTCERMDGDSPSHSRSIKKDCVAAVVNVVNALARCPQLISVNFRMYYWTLDTSLDAIEANIDVSESASVIRTGAGSDASDAADVDSALANLLRRCPRLETLTVEGIHSEGVRPSIPHAPFDYPHLFKAMAASYSLHALRLDRVNNDQMKNMDTLLMLNRAGRGYVATDPSSKGKAADVLAKVSDRLDCLFIHLVENPSCFW
jgi:hypothetical protein